MCVCKRCPRVDVEFAAFGQAGCQQTPEHLLSLPCHRHLTQSPHFIAEESEERMEGLDNSSSEVTRIGLVELPRSAAVAGFWTCSGPTAHIAVCSVAHSSEWKHSLLVGGGALRLKLTRYENLGNSVDYRILTVPLQGYES